MRSSTSSVLLALTFAATVPAEAAPVVFSGAGSGAQSAFTDFQAALGATPRRIAWDGVRVDGTDANPNTQVIAQNSTVAIPVDRFRAVGAIFADPYAVSGDGFATVNPATAGRFPAFSTPNTFVMFDPDPNAFDDQGIEQSFVLAGTNTAAGTRGFGAIFLDVEQAGSAAIEYFGVTSGGGRVSLGRYEVPVAGAASASFLGVLFDNPIVSDVELTVGSRALFNFDGGTFRSFGAQDLARGIDLVATDDFLFANPVALQTVPEPNPLALMLASAMLFVLSRRRKNDAAVR